MIALQFRRVAWGSKFNRRSSGVTSLVDDVDGVFWIRSGAVALAGRSCTTRGEHETLLQIKNQWWVGITLAEAPVWASKVLVKKAVLD